MSDAWTGVIVWTGIWFFLGLTVGVMINFRANKESATRQKEGKG